MNPMTRINLSLHQLEAFVAVARYGGTLHPDHALLKVPQKWRGARERRAALQLVAPFRGGARVVEKL